MRRRLGIGLLTAAVLAFAGCKKDPYLRPPKPPEQLIASPVDDARFSQPPDFPKNVMNEDKIKRPNADKDTGAPGTMPHGGMSRPGGPSGGY
jgi:hypothetical protein